MTGWRQRHPAAAAEELGRWTITCAPQLEDLRVALRDVLAAQMAVGSSAATDLADRLLIVATELVGNALRHGQPPAVVAVLRDDDQLIVDVADADPQTVPVVSVNRPRGAGGLGLHLAERLSDEVGWHYAEAGKHVWAALKIPGS